MNHIGQVTTAAVSGPAGPAHAMMMAIHIDDPDAADAFVAQVVEHFKVRRMVAPPDTSILLITLMGDLPAERFAAAWHGLAQRDPVVSFFMARMTLADAVQGTPSGERLSSASLLPPDQPATPGTEPQQTP